MESAAAPRKFRIGEWQVDSTLDEIRAGERLVKLEPRTMRVLCVLAERPGEVWSADELLGRVWPGVMVTQSSVYQAIAQLRRVLGDDGEEARYIATVPRRGYRLIATVDASQAPVGSPEPDGGPAAEPPTPPTPQPPGPARPGGYPDAKAAPQVVAPPSRVRRLMAAGAALVVLGAVVAWWLRRDVAPIAPMKPAVAVLPFADLSDTGEFQGFCDGLSEELLNALARVPELRVTGRNSSFQFRGTGTDTRDVGRQLGVTHVIEGSVLHSGNRVRVRAQLVDAATGFQVWSNTFDRPRSDALAVQSEISRSVAAALELQLTPQSERALARPAALQVNAYDLYLLGRHQQLQRNVESLARAAEYHKQAIAADPKFALAHAGLADTYMAGFYYANQPVEEVAARVQPEIDAALRLDPELAEAYAAWSVLLVEQHRLDEAIAALERAIAINSNYSEAYLRLGYAYENAGRLHDALGAYDQVAVLDPLHTILHVRRCLVLPLLGRHADAERACDRGFELQPQLPNALWARGLLQLERGELGSAVESYLAALERAPNRVDIRSELAILYLDLGMPDVASRELATVRKQFWTTFFELVDARVDLARGDLAGLRRRLASMNLEAASVAESLDAAWLALAAVDEPLARRIFANIPAVGEDTAGLMPNLYGARWAVCSLCDVALLARVQGNKALAEDYGRRMQAWFAGFEAQEAGWNGLFYLRASLNAQSGEREAALRDLERAVELGWRRGWLMRADASWNALREDPRYLALVEKIEVDVARQRDSVLASAES